MTLTASAIRTYLTCPRKYDFAYRHRIRPERQSDALRFGSAFHKVMELIDLGTEWADICKWVMQNTIDEIETQQVLRLAAEHHRYHGEPNTVEETEHVWQADIHGVQCQGMIDRIVRLPDGRRAVQEYKTSGQDIAPGSTYWEKLRVDMQISMYLIASGADTILYDVTRKPTIRPLQVPLLDDDGVKIVTDDETGERVQNKNGTWKQSATTGCTLATRPETPEEYGERLTADIRERPEYYFQRHEIARMPGDVDAAKEDIQDVARLIDAGVYPRNTGACNHYGTCEYFQLCCNGHKPADGAPAGFVELTVEHPELSDDDQATTAAA